MKNRCLIEHILYAITWITLILQNYVRYLLNILLRTSIEITSDSSDLSDAYLYLDGFYHSFKKQNVWYDMQVFTHI